MGIYAVAVILLAGAVEADLFGYERHVPDAADIKDVSVSGYNSDPITFDEPENIEAVLKLHSNIISNKYLHETEHGSPEEVAYMAQFDDPAAVFLKRSVLITYTLQNDRTVTRRYQISYGPDEVLNLNSEIRAYEALLNTEEGVEERYTVDYAVGIDNIGSGWVEYKDAETFEGTHFSDFSPSELLRLYNECILPDIADGKLGVIDIIEDKDYAMSKYSCTIGLDLFERIEDTQNGGRSFKQYKSIQVYPTLEASRTMAFLKEYGIEPATVYDAQLAHGYDYNELGIFFADGSGNPYYDPATVSFRNEILKEATTAEIIGGADGPTAIVVTG